MASNYRLQIVDIRDGEVVRWKAGAAIEIDLVEELCDRLAKRKWGVGLLRPQTSVVAAVKEEFASLVYDLKARTIYNPDSH
jgi:UDP-N-acetyl-D-mannosaminuronic acid transferase (WecB/TagA/CpsF family)